MDEALTEVKVELARINTKLDLFLAKQDDHETRIRSLEKAKWLVAGVCSAGGGTIGTIISNFLGA